MYRFQYEIIRVPPFHYLHVLDNNANVVRVVEGPSRYTCLGHEKVILGPEPMYAPSPRGLLFSSLLFRVSLVS
jgi:hypothetical protein